MIARSPIASARHVLSGLLALLVVSGQALGQESEGHEVY